MMFWFTSRGDLPGDFGLYRFWQSREDIPARPLHLRAERILVQPNYRRLPRAVINRHDIKPAWAFAHLRAERILVQPNYRRLPRAVINRHDIKPAWAFADVTLHKKSLR